MANIPIIAETRIDGCFRVKLPRHPDARGCFVKSFHLPTFESSGLQSHFAEDFFSISRKDVLRGFHFTSPPRHGAKLVYVIQGSVFDAILDLRPSSPTYGQHQSFELDAEHGDAIYLAAGIAHAFLATSEVTIVGYKAECAHHGDNDAGVRWDSASVAWPISEPILSERDRALPPLAQYSSPFP